MPRRQPTSAAWLTSIELENVRCFQERQVVNFTALDGKKAPWTLLLGENGTGKSTLLAACAMLMPRRWARNKDRTYRAISAFDERDTGGWDRLLRTARPRDRAAQMALSLRTAMGEARWAWQTKPSHGALLSGPTGEIPSFKDPLPPLPLCLAYGPYRSPWTFIPEDTSPDQTHRLFDGFTRLRHPGEWFRDRTFATVNPDSDEKSKATAQKILERVRETLLSVLPDVSDLRIDTEHEGRGPNRLRAKTPYGWVDISALGMGYQSILSLIVDIASRLVDYFPESPNPHEEPAVVLIDEIDLHLHPTWQRTLQQQLSDRFPNIQFIATAHSPLIVQSSPSANVVLLRREDDHVIIERAPDAIKTWRVDQILTSDLFGLPSARPPQLDGLIKKRDAILAKSKLSSADEKRLSDLRAKIGSLPGGESPWEMEAMELLRDASRTLKPASSEGLERRIRGGKGRR